MLSASRRGLGNMGHPDMIPGRRPLLFVTLFFLREFPGGHGGPFHNMWHQSPLTPHKIAQSLSLSRRKQIKILGKKK
jgi:hypothetical protein